MTQPYATDVERAAGFAVCIRNAGCPAALELHRLYRTRADREDERQGLLQVVDEVGLGYLCPDEFFHRVAPRPVQAPPDAAELRFALCVGEDGAEGDLTRGGIYAVLPDPAAKRDRWIRVIDDGGEDSLHPAALFLMVHVPDALKEDLLHAS